jgi:hypothetical protein
VRGKDLLFYLIGIGAATIMLLWAVICMVFNLKAVEDQSDDAEARRQETIKYGHEVIKDVLRVFRK